VHISISKSPGLFSPHNYLNFGAFTKRMFNVSMGKWRIYLSLRALFSTAWHVPTTLHGYHLASENLSWIGLINRNGKGLLIRKINANATIAARKKLWTWLVYITIKVKWCRSFSFTFMVRLFSFSFIIYSYYLLYP